MSKKHKKHHKYDRDSDGEKPGLKLVLKVGTPDVGNSTPPPTDHDGERKHRHKKKKKKHKHHRDEQDAEFRVKLEKRKSEHLKEMELSDPEEEIAPPPVKKHITENNLNATLIAGRNLRERKNNEDEQTPLQKCLDYLHNILVKKDINGFFAYPVTDNIAPSYSKIILHPMDMSTMKENIDANQYATLLDYKADFKLMCDNCMTYNHPDTIYYKEAEKLLKSGLKLMSKEKMIQLKRCMPFMAMVTDSDLGIDQDQSLDGSAGVDSALKQLVLKPKVKKTVLSKFEAFPDRLTPEQILAQAQDAAKDANDQLSMRRPNTKFGFLHRDEDGSTTLNLLNPDNDGIVSHKERVVNLGTLLGKLQSGSGVLTGFKEDKRNKALPVNYLNYGPFSSYAPVYDSSNANLSKEDSDLLINAYGDEAGTQYAYSICHFVKDSGDYAVRMVDNLLDIITSGDHSKACAVLRKVEEAEKDDTPETTKIKVEPEEQMPSTDQCCQSTDVDFTALRSLSELGIDTGFIDDLETKLKKEQEIQKKLDTTCEMLKDLQETQYKRLSQTLPSHMGIVKAQDDKEQEIATKVSQNLKELAKEVSPGSLTSPSAVHHSLGVTVVPDMDSPNPEEASSAITDGPTVAAADTTTDDLDIGETSPSTEGTSQQQQEQQQQELQQQQ